MLAWSAINVGLERYKHKAHNRTRAGGQAEAVARGSGGSGIPTLREV